MCIRQEYNKQQNFSVAKESSSKQDIGDMLQSGLNF